MADIINFFLTMSLNIIKRNVLHTKILQMLGGLPSFSPYIQQYIKDSMNKVTHTADEIDYHTLLYVIGEYNIKLKHLEPVNAGMVSLVYDGIDASGNDVIIKLKRKGIYNRIEHDFEQIKLMVTLMEKLSYFFSGINKFLDSVRSLVDTEDYILSQCNFNQEIQALNRIKNVIDCYTDDFVIPLCYNKVTDIESEGVNFIIMEKIVGTDCLSVPSEHKEILCSLLSKFTFTTMLHSDYYHMDLHPGNILLLDNNGVKKMGVIDFGMNLKPSEHIKTVEKYAIKRMMDIRDDTDVIDAFKYSFTNPSAFDNLTIKNKDLFTIVANDFIDNSTNGMMDESIIYDTLKKCRNIVRSDSLFFSLEIVKLSLGLSMMLSSIRTLLLDPITLIIDHKKMKSILKQSLKEVYMY